MSSRLIKHMLSDDSAPAPRGDGGREHEPVEGGMSRTFVPSTEQEGDEEFPPLSTTAKTDDRDQGPSISSKPPRENLPQNTQGLVYSSLRDRLALEAEAAVMAAVAVSSGGGETKSSSYQLRLKVLPGFGKNRDERAGLQDCYGRSTGVPNELVGRGEGDDWRDFAAIQQLMLARSITSGESFLQISPVSPPSAPSPPTGTVVTLKERRPYSATLSPPLRERLRQRWFRLEALKKAELQREAIERELMGVEDRVAEVEGDIGRGTSDRGVGSSWVRRLQSGGRPGAEQTNGGEASSSSGDGGDAKDRSSEGDDLADSDCEGGLPVAATTGPSHKGGELVNAKAGPRQQNMVFATSPLVPAYEAIGTRIPSRPMSASGAAAIRRSQAEAESRSQGMIASVALTAGPPSDFASAAPGTTGKTNKTSQAWSFSEEEVGARKGDHREPPLQVNDSAAVQDGSLTRVITVEEDDGGLQAGITTHIHAVCEAGLARELNELLVRSFGRAADERDEVRDT